MEEKVVIIHGFSKEQLYTVIRAIKGAVEKPQEIAFAKTTPHSLTMQLGAVVKDVAEEHAYMRNRPPASPPQEPKK